MVECGCEPRQNIMSPEPIIERCPTPIKELPIIQVKSEIVPTVKNCFNSLALGFSNRNSCKGIDCGN